MSQKSWHVFYQKLGYLFYSIAAADKQIRTEEVSTLHSEIKKHWTGIESTQDEYGTDAAYQIEIVFDWIQENELDSERAFRIFETYYHESPEMFDKTMVAQIHKTANAIVNAFHGTNKAEHSILMRLQSLMGK